MSRIIAADSANAPIYGHYLKQPENRPHLRSLALKEKEIILTFDDGPLAPQTREVIDILDKHCIKAMFFSVGKMAKANPKLLQELERRGHTVGTHTWSHPGKMDEMSQEDIKYEVEKGFIAVSEAMGRPIPPFMRFPGLRESKQALSYLRARNVSVWSVDVISGDTEPGATSAKIRHDTVSRMKQQGKGIVLLHDIKRITVDALDGIITDLKADGFRFVQAVSNTAYQPSPDVIDKPELNGAPAVAQMTITGRMVAAVKEQIKDGSVNVLHTEWIDLQQANDVLSGAPVAAAAAPASGVTRTSTGSQPAPQYQATGWTTGGRVR
jgi:peptidoglycan/xylan/chitin deacetylase (PgdA/CDA1 family)